MYFPKEIVVIKAVLCFACLASATTVLSAQQAVVKPDTSPHKVQFVTVEPDVNLEVLDWGGTGRPLVFLAGIRFGCPRVRRLRP
jgi:hypothetical protein